MLEVSTGNNAEVKMCRCSIRMLCITEELAAISEHYMHKTHGHTWTQAQNHTYQSKLLHQSCTQQRPAVTLLQPTRTWQSGHALQLGWQTGEGFLSLRVILPTESHLFSAPLMHYYQLILLSSSISNRMYRRSPLVSSPSPLSTD